MWGPVVVTVEPAAEPVLTVDLVAHVRGPEDGQDDDLLDGYALAARAHIEQMTGTKLINQTVRFKATEWDDMEALPVAPLSAVASVTYTDTDGQSQTLSTNVYEARLDGLEPAIVLKAEQSWPSIRPGSQVIVTGTAGYGAAGSNVPAAILQAIKLIVGDAYLHRESTSDSPAMTAPVVATVDALLSNFRKHLI